MAKEITFDRLKGRDNYATWEIHILSFLRTRDLFKCILPAPKTENDEDKLSRAVGWLFLACEDRVTNHFSKNDTPLAIWQKLHKIYAEKGDGLHLQAVMKLSHTYRLDCESNDDYIGQMMEAWRRCDDVGIKFEDHVVALFMLGNLGPNFDSFRQGLVGSGQKLTTEIVANGLIDLPSAKSGNADTAFYGGAPRGGTTKRLGSSGPSRNLTRIKCFGCGQLGHFRNKCPKGSGNNSTADDSKYKKPAEAKFAAAFSAITGRRDDNDWFLDSGASRHMTPRRDILLNFRMIDSPGISVADDRRLKVEGCGDVQLTMDDGELTLKNVLFVPDLRANLLSLDVISRSGHRIELDDGVCKVFNKSDGNLIIRARSSGGTFKVDAGHIKCMLVRDDELLDWHRKMGHMSYTGLKSLQRTDDNININGKREIIRNCFNCAEGKQSRAPFHKKDVEIKTSSILELIHSDLCGPMSTSLGGARYFSVFVDDFSRKVFVYFLQEKSALVGAFRNFKAKMENQSGFKIKRLRTDNGTEFVNNEMDKICAEAGIVHEKTIPYTPQQNGVSERMNRTIIERARCMLSDANLEQTLWAEAVHHAAYLINRSVNRSVGDRSPEEVWSGVKPDLSSLKLFGNPAMVHVAKVKRTKWSPKAIEMLFVGYTDTENGLRFYDPATKRIMTSRDATFLTQRPAKSGSFFYTDDDPTMSVGESASTGVEKAKDTGGPERTSDKVPGGNSVEEGTSIDDSRQVKIESADSIESHGRETPNENESLDGDEYEDAHSSDPDYEPSNEDVQTENDAEPRRSKRTPRPVTRDGFISYFTRDCDAADPLTREHANDAHDCDQWQAAMIEELESFEANETWSLVELPPNRKPIKTMWVFKRKRAEDGTVVRHRARLVAKGCSQKYGIDYDETFSPVVRYGSIRLLIALAAARGLQIDQMDAVTAYLQGTLNEDIYTTQPEGFEDGSGRVCKLHRAMYGLKQSGRRWNECLDAALKSFGLEKSAEDPCVYYKADGSLIVAIYVDDFLIFWENEIVRDDLKQKLSSTFRMKDLGTARTCVGMTIEYEENVISINQSVYAEEILNRFGMENCKPSSSPCDLSQKLSVNSEGSDVSVPYREAVGALLFLVQTTRPDLAFSVSNVSRFNGDHNATHWTGVKRIMRYLKATLNYRIGYRRGTGEPLQGYCDADWAGERDECRSYSGYLFKLSGGAISWSCKRQTSVAVSSTEAEYVAMAHATKEAIWLVRFIRQFEDLKGIIIHCDNQSAMGMAEKEGFSPRVKHVDVSYHFTRHHVMSGLITFKYVPSAENIADCLTKGVSGPKMEYGANGFGMFVSTVKTLEQ